MERKRWISKGVKIEKGGVWKNKMESWKRNEIWWYAINERTLSLLWLGIFIIIILIDWLCKGINR